MNKEDLLQNLNKEQKEAVVYTEGPLLILAGAGSGKTRVLTHRIGYLIENGTAPWNILAITFTNKAAGEMRERVDRMLDDRTAEAVSVSTFHSMCVRLLRRDIERLGYARDFTIYDTDDQRTLIRGCIKALKLDTKIYKERAMLKIISDLKNEMSSPEDFEQSAGDFYDRNAAKIYEEYEKELKSNNALDFDDLLLKTAELFRTCPDVLSHWQERYRYIMVDEYQDTNNVQFELVRMLAGKYGNLSVVGDDDQSIYKFRGANIENILNFEKTFPGAKVIKLEQNYRSTKSILNAANEVIRNNTGRKPKKLWTDNEEGDLPVFTEYDTAAGEAEGIIREAERNAGSGADYRNQAVLYRTNAQSRLLEEKCIARSIPYIIVGGVNFYQRREIKDILSYLRIICNPTDDLACTRVINVPKRGIGQTSVDRVAAFAERSGISFYDALKVCDTIPGIGSGAKKIKGFTGFIEELRESLESGELSLRTLIEAVRDKSGYIEELRKEDEVTLQTRLENIEELINKAVSFEEDGPDQSRYIEDEVSETGDSASEETKEGLALLGSFLEDVSLVADIDRTNDQDDVLTMMTLHAAKGLEFDTVYMAGMEDGLFPSSASINAEDPVSEIEEERRLCYVGITRARKKLYLSSAKERMVNGEVHYMKASRFIDEIPDDAAEKHFRSSRNMSRPAFAGFGGYEGRMERETDYGFRYGNDEGTDFSKKYSEQVYSGGRTAEEKAYSSYNAFQSTIHGQFGSLDRAPAGKRGHAGKKGLASIDGLKKGFSSVSGNQQIKQKPDYAEGDRVSHIKFGTGTVTSIIEDVRDYKVTVDFDEAGTKVMFAGFAKLQKL